MSRVAPSPTRASTSRLPRRPPWLSLLAALPGTRWRAPLTGEVRAAVCSPAFWGLLWRVRMPSTPSTEGRIGGMPDEGRNGCQHRLCYRRGGGYRDRVSRRQDLRLANRMDHSRADARRLRGHDLARGGTGVVAGH